MKTIPVALYITALFLIACNNATPDEKLETAPNTVSEKTEKKTEEAWVAVDSATEMKAWTEYATPSAQHQTLAKSSGNWKCNMTMWMGIGAQPTSSTGKMVNKMILGGRYQLSSYKGDFMGMPFEGMSITAFDNYQKKYISNWIDNMGTGIMKMEGTWDDATKTINYTGKMMNPANGKECQMKEVYKIVDEKTEIMEMYGPDSKTGKQYKNMEIKLTKI